MIKLYFTKSIDAPVEKVWNTMLDEESYRNWTEAFSPGSHYKGSWKEGSKILFLAPDESGRMSGMVSRIKENRLYEYISIEHFGIIENGREDTNSEEVRKWAGARENYTFKDLGGKTELNIEMDTIEEYEEMFKKLWPDALQRLKELSEELGVGVDNL